MCRIPNGNNWCLVCALGLYSNSPSTMQILCNAKKILCKYCTMLRKNRGIAVQTQCTNKTPVVSIWNSAHMVYLQTCLLQKSFLPKKFEKLLPWAERSRPHRSGSALGLAQQGYTEFGKMPLLSNQPKTSRKKLSCRTETSCRNKNRAN